MKQEKSMKRLRARAIIFVLAFYPGVAPISFAEEITNSIGMRLVRIPAGSFTMGSTSGEYDEKPPHAVTISQDFFMGVYEVTNAQYEQFDSAHAALRSKDGFSSADNEPVIFVTWNDAVNFCKWLSNKEGVTYRLPTEAGWEYACRAGTTTKYNTGDTFSSSYGKNQLDNNPNYWALHGTGPWNSSGGMPVSLTVGTKAPVNAFGLYDMHGNVEEWCGDWWGGPYGSAAQTDPMGREKGMGVKVARGGAHNQEYKDLRSANRASAVPTDRSAMIGFRVVRGTAPSTTLLPAVTNAYQQNVVQQSAVDVTKGLDPDAPYFSGPRQYVKVPAGGPGDPVMNHDPAVTVCPNGDILAIWYSYSTDESEPGMVQMASRLRFGNSTWDEASLFWDAADRNDHAPSLWTDHNTGRIYHCTGISTYATYGNLAMMMRTSDDNGGTWGDPLMIGPDHGNGGNRTSDHQPTDSVFRMGDGTLVAVSDAGSGSVLHLSNDNGQTWSQPTTSDQKILGIHGNALELRDGNGNPNGRIMSVCRNAWVLNENGSRQMPRSITTDKGHTWIHTPMPFQRVTMGMRPTMTRLKEGPIVLATFIGGVKTKRSINDEWSSSWPGGSVIDAAGVSRGLSGLVVYISYDEGQTWPIRRVLSPNGPAQTVQTHYGWFFQMDTQHGENWGYLASCQNEDGIIHVMTSWNDYAFNLKWLESAMPAANSPEASISATPTSGDAPLTVNLAASLNMSDAGYTYTWNFGDGETATGKNQSHTFTQTGRYITTLIVSDNNGHWETKSVTIIVGGISQPQLGADQCRFTFGVARSRRSRSAETRCRPKSNAGCRSRIA